MLPGTKRPWSHEERNEVELHLAKFFTLYKVPGKSDCELCLKKAGEKLKERTWRDVKNFIHNRTYKWVCRVK